MLRKGVHPYEYKDDWQRFNERSLPEKEEFYSKLNMEDITDVISCIFIIHACKNSL